MELLSGLLPLAKKVISTLSPPSEPPEWFNSVPWLPSFLVFLVFIDCFEQYLNFRQLRSFRKTEAPPELRELVTPEEVKKSNEYNADKLMLGMLQSASSLGTSLIFFIFVIYPSLWQSAGAIVGSNNEYLQSLVFFALNVPLSLLSMPFELYRDFVIEERHGFNKKTMWLFFTDELKTLGLQAVIGCPAICILIWLARWSGKGFFLWMWGFLVFMTFFLMTIYPNLIAPLFNKFEPLQDEELRGKIEKLAKSLNFPLTKLYQMDGSKRSKHSNAYMYGFWRNKRIVIFDTLLELPHDQIIAVLGHELGHWKLGHTVKNMLLSFAGLLGMFWVFEVVMYTPSLYTSFGFTVTDSVTGTDNNGMSLIIGLFLFSNIISPVSTVESFLKTLLSRRHEFQADAFAVGLGYGDSLQKGLMDIFKQNLGGFDPDPWFAWYHYSHPPLVERLRALNEEKKKDR